MANTVKFRSVLHIKCLCGSSQAFKLEKHPMVRLLYRFLVYYYVRRILKRLQVPLPHKAGFEAADNPYTNDEFLKNCEDYEGPHDPMKCRDDITAKIKTVVCY